VDGLFVVWLKRGYLVTAVPERDGITVTKRVEIQDDGTLVCTCGGSVKRLQCAAFPLTQPQFLSLQMWTITRQDVVMHRWFKRSS